MWRNKILPSLTFWTSPAEREFIVGQPDNSFPYGIDNRTAVHFHEEITMGLLFFLVGKL